LTEITMPTSKTKSRRKAPPPSFLDGLPVRTIAVTVGLVGLAALAVALIGPRRVRDEFVRPISNATWVPVSTAVTSQTERAWAETRPLRDRLGNVLSAINTEEVRNLIAGRLSQWAERFR
jgi:hypothetical protein